MAPTPYVDCAMNILRLHTSGPTETRDVIMYLVAKLESLGVPFTETVGPFFPQPASAMGFYPMGQPQAEYYNEPVYAQQEQESYASGPYYPVKKIPKNRWNQKQKHSKKVNFADLKRSEEPDTAPTEAPNSPPPLEDNVSEPSQSVSCKSDKSNKGKVDWNALRKAKDEESYIVMVNEVEGLIKGKIADLM